MKNQIIKDALNEEYIENFIRMNEDSFEFISVGDSVRVNMSMSKDLFNAEISSILYEHGQDIFRDRGMSRYSDVKDEILRTGIFESKEKGMEFLIKDTTQAISEYAQSAEKRRESSVLLSQTKEDKSSILSKIVNRVFSSESNSSVDIH